MGGSFPAFFREKIRAETAGRAGDRQQAPPESLQKSRAKNPPEMGGGILQGAAPAEWWTIGGNMGGGHAGNAAALAESPRRGVLCARYQVYTRAIYGPL